MKHKKDTAPTGGQTELFCREAFHANPTHLPGSDSEKRMNATCGRKCVESFKKLNRHGLWAKTFSDLLIGRTDWYSTRCRLIWRLKGTKYKRLYFQLAPQTLRTDATEFGLLQSLLKTPCAADAYADSLSKKEQKMGNSGTLAQEIATGFVYQRGLLPTPTVNDMKNATLPPSQSNRNDSIVKRILSEDSEIGTTSQLNPRFVLEMMGFPPNWTELPFRSGETSQSKPQATP